MNLYSIFISTLSIPQHIVFSRGETTYFGNGKIHPMPHMMKLGLPRVQYIYREVSSDIMYLGYADKLSLTCDENFLFLQLWIVFGKIIAKVSLEDSSAISFLKFLKFVVEK